MISAVRGDSVAAPNGGSLIHEIVLPAEHAADLCDFLGFLGEWLAAYLD